MISCELFLLKSLGLFWAIGRRWQELMGSHGREGVGDDGDDGGRGGDLGQLARRPGDVQVRVPQRALRLQHVLVEPGSL